MSNTGSQHDYSSVLLFAGSCVKECYEDLRLVQSVFTLLKKEEGGPPLTTQKSCAQNHGIFIAQKPCGMEGN